MIHKRNVVIALTLLAAVLLSACTGVLASVPQAKPVQFEFMSHLAMGLPEQDVFVEQEPGSDQVVRITAEEKDQYADAPVFAATELVEHDPFSIGDAPLGPFEKGAALGMTMGEWLAAGGTGSYTLIGNQAKITLQLENLVPNGVYTVWCSRLSFPPNVHVVDEPCGAADGSENGFTADKKGRGHFNLTLPALEESSPETATVIAIAYHSDGQTYGAYPGDFGFNSHVPIVGMVPQPE